MSTYGHQWCVDLFSSENRYITRKGFFPITIVNAIRMDTEFSVVTPKGQVEGRQGQWLVNDLRGSRMFILNHKDFFQQFQPMEQTNQYEWINQ